MGRRHYRKKKSPIKAYVTVQEGCDKFCSFCIVPKTRGREVCRPLPDIVREAEALVAKETGEIMLLGQNINSYRWEGRDFAGLLNSVARIEGLRRLRFVTSYPRDFDEAMMDAMAAPCLSSCRRSVRKSIRDLLRRSSL